MLWKVYLCLLAMFLPFGAQSQPPLQPPFVDDPRDDGFYMLAEINPFAAEPAPLGVGVLRPRVIGIEKLAPTSPYAGLNWLLHTSLPLFERPNQALFGWLSDGWLLFENGARQALAETPISCIPLQTALAGLTVLEQRDDGWFRFGSLAVTGAVGGGFWSHERYLDLGTLELEIQSWRLLLLEATAPLYLRHTPMAGVALLVEPDDYADTQVRIFADHDLEIEQMQGDWIKVRVHQPAKFCRPGQTAKVNSVSGWLRWFEPKRGPVLFFPAKGC